MFSNIAFCATLVWQSDVEGNFSDAGNWNPAQAPQAGDNIGFWDGHHGNCVIDVNASLGWFDTSGYNGIIKQSGGDIETSGDFNIYTGSLVTTNNHTLNIGTTAGQFRVGADGRGACSADLSDAGDVTVSGHLILYQDADDTATITFGSQTVTIGQTMYIDGDQGGSTGGTINAGSALIKVGNSWDADAATSVFNCGASTVESTCGTGVHVGWRTKGASPFNNMTKTGEGTLWMETDAIINGDLTVSSGTFRQDGAGSERQLTLKGNLAVASGVSWEYSTDTPSILFNGADTQLFTANGQTFGDVQVSTNGTNVEMQNGSATFDAFTIDANTTFSLDSTSGTSTLNITAGETLTNSGSFKILSDASRTTLQGSGGVFDYTGTDIDYNTNTITLANVDYQTNILLDTAGDRITLGDDNCVFDDMVITAGSFSSNDYAAEFSGNWEISGSGSYTPGDSNIILSGAGKTIISSSSGNDDFYDLTVSGTYTLEDPLAVSHDVTISGTLDAKDSEDNNLTVARNITVADGGTLTARGSTITITGDGTFDIQGTFNDNTSLVDLQGTGEIKGDWWIDFYDLQCGAAGETTSLNLEVDWQGIDINHSLTVGTGTLDEAIANQKISLYSATVTNNGTIDITEYQAQSGTSSMNGGDYSDTIIQILDGSTLNLTGSVTSSGDWRIGYLASSSGLLQTVNMNNNNITSSGTIRVGEDNTDRWGVINCGAGNIEAAAIITRKQFDASSNVINFGSGTHVFTGDVTFENASVTLSSDSITVGGNFYAMTNGTITHGSGTVILNGSSSTDLRMDGDNNLFNLTIDKTSAANTVTYQDTINDLQLEGALDIQDGTLDITDTIVIDGAVTVGNGADQASTLKSTTNSLSFTFNDDVSIASDGSFDFQADSQTIRFDNEAGDLVDVASGGSFIIKGTAGNLATLSNDSGTDKWHINNGNAQDQSANIAYVTVSYSDATGGTTIQPAATAVDGNNNENWLFGGAGADQIAGTVYQQDEASVITQDANIYMCLYDTSEATQTTINTTATANIGTYSFTGLSLDAGDIATIYIEDHATYEATTVIRTDADGAADVDLYDEHTIIRSDSGSITNANLDSADNGDTDIHYAVTGNDVSFAGIAETYIWAGGTYAPGGAITLVEDLDIRGTFTMADNNVSRIDGSWNTEGSGSFSATTNTVTFWASAQTDSIASNDSSFNNVTFYQPAPVANTWNIQDDFTVASNLSCTAETINFNGHDISIGGNFALSNGVTVNAGASEITVGGNISFNPIGGTDFAYDTSTVVFNNNAIVSTIGGTFNFYNLKCTTAGKELNFEAGTNHSILNTLTVTGANGSLVKLHSSVNDNKWDITLPNGAQTISFADVKDGNANANTVTCYNSDDNGNNNANWIFDDLDIITPEAGKTVGQTPTIRGDAGAGDVVTIKGTVGTVPYQTVAQVTADANGNYIVRQADYTGTLDVGANNLRADIGATTGTPVAVIVSAAPTTNQVPTITSPVSGSSISGATPDLSGSGLAGQNVTVSAWDANGNLLLADVATAVVGLGGAWSVPGENYTTSLVRGTNYLIVTVGGVASDVITLQFTDPFGIVFDSSTNEPIANAIVTIYNQNGTLCVPGVDIAGGDLNPQTTGADGFYSFLCANANFYITVEAPGYTYPSRKMTFPTGRTIVNGSKGEVFTVAGVVIEMDHPLDSNDLLLQIKKEANKKEAVIGDIVTYTVTIKNVGSTDVRGVFLEDRIPGGFKYVTDRATLDNIPTNPAGSTALLFDIGTVEAQATRTLRYQLIVGSGVTQGNYENRAWARYSDETVISNKDSATVKITLDPLFDLGNFIGKVFWDKNENGYQDEGENPIPFVSIAMEDGTVVITDKNGRYHIPAIKPGRHVLRLDESTLPEGAYLTTDKAVIVDITNGLLGKVNFGVNKVENEISSAIRIIQKKDISEPFLNVALYPEPIKLYKDAPVLNNALGEYEFRIFTNYSLFIDSWQIDILDRSTKEITKTFKGTGADVNKPIIWTNPDLDPDKEYSYQLKVYDKDGIEDATLEKYLNIILVEKTSFIQKEDVKAKENWIREEASRNLLQRQNIKIKGDTLLIKNTDGFETQAVNQPSNRSLIDAIYIDETVIDTDSVIQDKDNNYELILPEGEHKVVAAATNTAGETITSAKELSVNDNYLFFVAMGDAKAGYTFHSGSIEPIQHDDKYQDGFWSEGKLAYYLKGKVLGKFLITSSLDTDRKQKELFRNLDPDKYYPIYGDASEIDYQATETQGALYLLVEWDQSSFTWGNYVIDFTDTDLAGFKRTLYGAKLDYESVSKTKFGQPNTHLVAFKARAQQQAAHVEFLGTGGSLFYLKHKNVIEGSEKITIEVRDKISGLVLATMEQEEGFDYEIDYDHGRIIFWQPVSHITESDTIISSYLLNGNPVYITADYEYEVEDKYDRGVYGGRLEQALGDYFSVGSTYVKEEQSDKNYQLAGTDASLRLGEKTTVTAEYAESHAEELSSYISTDGGLSFTELSTNEDTRGRAYGVRASTYAIKGLGVEAYYKKIEENFSSISTTQEQGKELTGGKLTYDLTDKTRVTLRHDTQELIDGGNLSSSLQVGANKTETTSAQIIHTLKGTSKFKGLKLTGEYRHQEAEGIITAFESEANADQDLLALKADYKLTDDIILSLEQQSAIRGEANNQTSAGIQTRINEKLTLRAKQALGTKGAATSLGASYNITDKLEILSDYALGGFNGSSTDNSFSLTTKAKGEEGEELYHTYTVAHDDIEGKKYSQVTGTKRTFENGMEFKIEEGKSLLEGEKTNTNIFGLSGDINDKIAGFLQFEKGEVQNLDGTQTKRNAISLGGSYVEADWLKASSKLELRLDKSEEDARQYLSYNAAELKPNEEVTLFAKANLSQSDNTTNDFRQGMYREFSLAAAYRPVTNDKLNFFSKYTYLRDDSPSSQDDYTNIEEEKAHVIAAEGAYDLSNKWQLVEKIAMKMSEEKVSGFDFTESQTFLSVNRLNYCIDANWKVGAEYRFLTQKQAKDSKHGALLEVSREIGPYAELGLGYNFTDFNDDLTHLDYTSHGPFIRVTGKFYDRSDKEKERDRQKQLEKNVERWAYERIKEDNLQIQELNRQFKKAKQLQGEGRLDEARTLYAQVYNQARALYIQEKEYIKEKISFEDELRAQDELAEKNYKEGKLQEARRLWQDIIDKIQRSKEK
jgi:uncharacterized repeat protein (TIGR01451 family)